MSEVTYQLECPENLVVTLKVKATVKELNAILKAMAGYEYDAYGFKAAISNIVYEAEKKFSAEMKEAGR